MAHDSTFVAALTEQAKAFISPVGQIADFHTVPNGWLRCDGSTYNISEYPALFAAVGTKYGGDGKTTFAVPNLHRKFREGTTTDSEVGTSVSAGSAPTSRANTQIRIIRFLTRGTLAQACPGHLRLRQPPTDEELGIQTARIPGRTFCSTHPVLIRLMGRPRRCSLLPLASSHALRLRL